jgi:ferrous iron transport protein B
MSQCHDAGAAVAAAPGSTASGSTRRYTIALVGPPNCGKTTLFNRLTGLRQKVANYPGVTVEKHVGRAKLVGHGEVDIVDLPGIYSMDPQSEDERVTHDVLKGRMADVPRPNAVIIVVDSTNLPRHLAIAGPVLKLGLPALVVLNMADELKSRGGLVDLDALSRELDAPVALVSAAQGLGVQAVFDFLARTTTPPKKVDLPILHTAPGRRQWAASVTANARYSPPASPEWTRRLDRVFLHPVAGPLIFLAVVILVFQAMFSWATPLMDGIDWGIQTSGQWIGAVLPAGLARSMVVDGIWSGVGSVVVFLPQILILFLLIGILEDSGYLSRAAVIADRTMARAGLQGKAFIPLLSAYACAVPAIMSTRTIESPRDRLATILIAPFMTCSARLPVYTLIIAAFVPERQVLGPIGIRALLMLGLYVLGFAAAFVTAQLLKSTVLKSRNHGFMMELPAYRWPTWWGLGLRLVDRARAFLTRAGTVILGISLVLWVLATFPLNERGEAAPIEQSYAGQIGKAVEPLVQPLGFNWKIGIGLVTSLAAREVIVSTLGTIYGIEGAEEDPGSLQAALKTDLTPGAAVSLLMFFAFALQCMSTVAIVRRETGGWKWPVLQFMFMLGVAYLCAFTVHAIWP